MFNIAVVIDVFVDPQYVLHVANLLITNYYLSIIGIVFATVWSTSTSVKKSQPDVPNWQL
ncbi:uncharacterized protein PHACADRAFT_197086 [Phanerochaete carnosa HHB-10118-sp]|uniref:Uncharacterized protein n=1 Tax=Phanerochaete carnosa (strain HHB-10118-sp) TaxID=650164 RepID=K5UX38_PHACS|nr:uncharacterized protein PHACADRAFT_197086 [Phanerochaete carnosa HHB-10118-sp]EKM54656.1 hypothetical protein PHACADRAFT_197086 [Phanerochaete carnosa HHB-10118-sp]